MKRLRVLFCASVLAAAAVLAFSPAMAADDILEAIDQARKAYQAGDMTAAKQSLDLASTLIGQKNAEGFAKMLPEPLAGWQAEKAQSNAVGGVVFGGVSSASRNYSNAKGDNVEISISGDSALLTQFAPMMSNPAMAAMMGKLIKVGSQRAVQNQDGDIVMVVANKFLINVQGSADAASKLAYAQAIDVAKLSKM
jgi:hypothetical protein